MRIVGVMLLAACCGWAAERWTVDDVLMQERVSGVEISRDGGKVVWVQSKMDAEKGVSVSHLFVKYLADGHQVQLTRGKDSASWPRFSPDGNRLAFLTSRKSSEGGGESGAPAGGGDEEGGNQVWLLDLRGGEPYQLTRLAKGVRSFAWLDDERLLLVAPEDPSAYEQEIKKRKDTSNVVDDEENEPPVRLFRFSLKDKKTTRLTTNTDRITSLAVSPDGAWAVTSHNRSLREIFDQKIKPVYFLHDLKNGTASQLFAGIKLHPRRFEFTPDSKGFYFIAPFTNDPLYYNASIDLLYYYDLSAPRHQPVNLDWENGLAFGVKAVPGGFLASLANGARPKTALYQASGAGFTRTWLEGEHASHIFGMEISPDGKTLLYNYTTASIPGGWYAARLEGARITEPRLTIEVNKNWKEKPKAKTELVYWKGALNEQVEGILYYPHHYEPGKKYPLVVMIHGGPHGADFDSFSESMYTYHQIMAQKGAFILEPNYHGSSQYGLKWGESITKGKYNDLEWIDVETGVDALIAKGLVDPEKLGVMGWSNGAIITIELTTRTTRYKAAGAGAGDVNWISDWGNAVFGDAFDNYYLGKRPMDDPMFYVQKSPLFRMDKVRTPTIIFFGTVDRQVPTEQGWQHYNALKHYGHTDVRFILFPGEAHGPRKLVHQRRKMEEEIAWFDKYLFGAAPQHPKSLRRNSPLAAALLAAKMGDLPDMVEQGKIWISRFEVTRAQFAAFDPAYRYPPGTGHYPANGITFEQAKAYCAWLSQKTGQAYRLGTEEELGGRLKPDKNENTLDAWAGYTINADDAERLREILKGLPEGALLKPVGSYPGSGDDPLYDLGGNVAEWVVTKEGAGKALGGSADRPADDKADTPPHPAYIGFRVVRE